MANPSVKKTVGPVAMSNTMTTNIYNNTSALIYDIIKHIHIANKANHEKNWTNASLTIVGGIP